PEAAAPTYPSDLTDDEWTQLEADRASHVHVVETPARVRHGVRTVLRAVTAVRGRRYATHVPWPCGRRGRWVDMAAWAVCLVLAACRYRATGLAVELDTDAPPERALTITATVRAGGATDGPAGPRASRSWTRGGTNATVTLPASFELVPG